MDSLGPDHSTQGDVATRQSEGPAGPEIQPGAPRKLPKWPFFVAGLLLVFGLSTFVVFAWPINLPYYSFAPGPVSDAGDFVVVEGGGEESDGELLFLTVSLDEVNAFEAVQAWVDDEVDLVPREFVRPEGTSPEELRRRNLASMDNSKETAIFVALSHLGYDVEFAGTGALVVNVGEGTPAAGVLDVGDVITAIDGRAVRSPDDAIEQLRRHLPGDVVALQVNRPVDASRSKFDPLTFEIELAVFKGTDADGAEVVDEQRGMIGVSLDDAEQDLTLPLDVEIDSENIGGPSAGLVFTLEIINQLTEDDLTEGHLIAGTGSINVDEEVGSIGGVRQKVFAARSVGADYILVPAGNYDEALTTDVDDIGIVRVETLDDALSFFETL